MTGAGARSSSTLRPRHFPCFDGLRAIAAVSVLLLHAAWVSGFTLTSSLGIYTSRLEIGVSVFFLISGFLLYRPFAASHLSGRPSPRIGKFWARRLLRIVPAYWLALSVLTYGLHLISMGSGWQGVASHYLFLQIYLPTEAFTGVPQAWSLCTEMSFYLFLPLYALVVGWRRNGPVRQLRREAAGLVVLVAVSFGFRWWALNLPIIVSRHGHLVAACSPHCLTQPVLASLMVDWLPATLDLFALGMGLAVASAWVAERGGEPPWLGHRLVPWVSWACAGVAFWGVSHLGIPRDILYVITPGVNLERQTLYGVFAFFLLVPAVFGPQDRGLVRRLLRSWPVASVGVVSYAVYLWHLNLITEILRWTGTTAPPLPFDQLAPAVFGLSVVVASISYFGLERPVLGVKDRIGWWSRVDRPFVDPVAVEPASDAATPEPGAASTLPVSAPAGPGAGSGTGASTGPAG
ncbi:MAG: acyltransferase family protein [Acidimicrobiales bacterium]